MHRKTPVPDWGKLQQGRNEEWQQPLPVTQGKPQFNLFCSEVPQFRIISTIDLSGSKLIFSQVSQMLAPLSSYEPVLCWYKNLLACGVSKYLLNSDH